MKVVSPQMEHPDFYGSHKVTKVHWAYLIDFLLCASLCLCDFVARGICFMWASYSARGTKTIGNKLQGWIKIFCHKVTKSPSCTKLSLLMFFTLWIFESLWLPKNRDVPFVAGRISFIRENKTPHPYFAYLFKQINSYWSNKSDN